MSFLVHEAKSWTHLLELLYADTWVQQWRRYRSDFVFRGLPDSSYGMLTSLIRLGGNCTELEPIILRSFRKYARNQVSQDDSLWNWITLAQHHGLPTRLMDWTVSPFVALHFATSEADKMDTDAAVWMTNLPHAHSFLPQDVASMKVHAFVFTVEMLDGAVDWRSKDFAEALKSFDRLDKSDFLLFFEPPSIDERIINQFSLFSVLSNPTIPVDQWLDKHDVEARKIIVPKKLKWEVRDKLDMANLTERVFFPGLDGLCAWLRRYYGPGPLGKPVTPVSVSEKKARKRRSR